MGKNYWMIVDTPENYEITKKLGFTIYGVGAKYRRRAQRMQPDDNVLFYITRIRKWVATALIKSPYFEDHTPIWPPSPEGDDYPFRVKMAPDMVLDEEDFIDAMLLAPRLEYVKRWPPEDWPLAFFDTLHLLPQTDFRLIEGEMRRVLQRKGKLPPEQATVANGANLNSRRGNSRGSRRRGGKNSSRRQNQRDRDKGDAEAAPQSVNEGSSADST